MFSFIAFPSNRPQVSAVTSAGSNKSPSSQIQGPYHVCSYGVKRPKLFETTPPDVICIHNVDSCVNCTTSIARGYSCTLFQRLHGLKKLFPELGFEPMTYSICIFFNRVSASFWLLHIIPDQSDRICGRNVCCTPTVIGKTRAHRFSS